jgi:xanthosine utilization system XapX-like protein
VGREIDLSRARRRVYAARSVVPALFPRAGSSWPALAARACPLLLAFVVALRPLRNFDLGYHVRTGELLLGPGYPAVDPFSYTVTRPWVLEQWLGSIFYYLAWAGGGFVGVTIVQAVLVVVVFALSGRAALRTGAPPLAVALAGVVGVLVAEPRFQARPFLFSMLSLATLVGALVTLRQQNVPWRGLWLAALFAVWPHFHPEYLTGFAVMGAFGVGAIGEVLLARWTTRLDAALDWRGVLRLVGIGVAGAGAAVTSLALLHPTGLESLVEVWGLSSSEFFRMNTNEVRPLWMNYGFTPSTIVLFAGPPLVWLAVRRGIVLSYVAIHVLLAVTAIRVGRMVGDAAVVIIPVWAHAAGLARDALAPRPLGRRLAGRAWVAQTALAVGVVALVAVYVQGGHGWQLDWDERFYPRRCFEWIETHDPPGNVWNDQFFGHILIFHFNGRRKVSMDQRANYTERDFRDYYAMGNAEPGWEDEAARLGVGWWLLYPSRHQELHYALTTSPNWQRVYSDGKCVIYLPRPSA